MNHTKASCVSYQSLPVKRGSMLSEYVIVEDDAAAALTPHPSPERRSPPVQPQAGLQHAAEGVEESSSGTHKGATPQHAGTNTPFGGHKRRWKETSPDEMAAASDEKLIKKRAAHQNEDDATNGEAEEEQTRAPSGVGAHLEVPPQVKLSDLRSAAFFTEKDIENAIHMAPVKTSGKDNLCLAFSYLLCSGEVPQKEQHAM